MVLTFTLKDRHPNLENTIVKIKNTIKVSDIKSYFLQEWETELDGKKTVEKSIVISMNDKVDIYKMVKKPKLVKKGNVESYVQTEEAQKVLENVTYFVNENVDVVYKELEEKFSKVNKA